MKTKPSGKQKLTLTVDSEVVEKAKEIGLNLSDITENVLRSFAFSPKEGDKQEVYAKYRELLESMKPVIADYGVSVEIANYIEDMDTMDEQQILLTPTGELWNASNEELVPSLEKVPLYLLHEPKQILANFVDSLSKEKQKRKERIEELEMARRIVLAMNERLVPKRKLERTQKS